MESRQPNDTIKELEQLLRTLIRDELSRHCADWWTSMVPSEIRARAESRKQKAETNFPSGKEYYAMEYLDFPNYMIIMDHG